MTEETKTVKKEQASMSVKSRIVKISNEIRVGKDGKNTFQNYDYFKPDDIAKALNPLLEKYNVIALFNMVFSKEKEMYEGKIAIEDLDSQDFVNYQFDIPLTTLKGTGEAQNAGATLTYCKRYMIMSIFNLGDNSSDPDNEKNKPAEKIDYKAILLKSTSLEELQKIWTSLPPIAKGQLNILKEEIKIKLTK